MCKLSRRLKPFVAIARHTGTKPLIEAHGHNLVLRGGRNGIVADRETQSRERATVEWPNADETFEGDDGKSPQVGAPIGLDAVNLFGTHVMRRSDHGAAVGQGTKRNVGGSGLGDTEVEDLGDDGSVAARQKDVFRLEIAMDDADLVCRANAFRHLANNFADFLDR